MKKIVIIAIITLVLFGGAIGISARKKLASNNAVKIAKVRKTDFRSIIHSSGKTAANRSVDLKFQTSGRLAWVGVGEGDTVAAWEAIAGLDVREVQKTLEKTLIDYSSQRNTFEDTRKYNQPANTAKDALNDKMRHILEDNQWDLDKAVLDVELKHLAVEFATLISPIAGIVTHIDTPIAGVNITPSTAVFSIADPNSTVFEANVDESDIADLTLGQEVTILLDAFAEASFSGSISFISYTSQQSSGGATIFPVKITFRNPPQTLRFGLNGDIEIITNQVPDALVIPLEAVRDDSQGQYVYIKTNDSYEKKPIETGLRNEDETIVKTGLSEGDVVVTKGFSNIPK